jgi:ribonuclease P protein subunit POP4
MMKAGEIARHELIGRLLEVTKARNKSIIGLKGRVINETKNSFTLFVDKKGKKTILKNHLIEVKVNGVVIGAGKVFGRPEDRIKVK